MEKLFILNPALDLVDVQNGLEERFNKIKGVLNCLIFSLESIQEEKGLDYCSAYHALWTIDGFLDEVACLQQKSNELKI